MIVEVYAGVGVVIMTTALVIGYSKKKSIDDSHIDEEIEAKQIRLKVLNDMIEARTIDSSVQLTKLEIEVLNFYDDSNIRIPVDIIEDLSRMKLDDKKEMISFIESQRHYWKLENSKKPFIRK